MAVRLPDEVLERGLGAEMEQPAGHRCHEPRPEVRREGVAQDRAARFRVELDRVDGRRGVPAGHMLAVVGLTVVDGRIREIDIVRDPAKLRSLTGEARAANTARDRTS